MSTITLTTSDLHDLLAPVLPHAGNDPTLPHLNTVRLEVQDRVLYAIATDRFTMAVTRHPLGEHADDTTVTIGRDDANALLKLFKHTRTSNPDLQLTVGTVEAETVLDPADRPTLTISAQDGNTLRLYGHEPLLPTWRKLLAAIIHREEGAASPRIVLNPSYLPRFAKAARWGGRMAMSFGTSPTNPIVIRADDDHFIGVCMPMQPVGAAAAFGPLKDSVWCKELPLEAETEEERPELLIDPDCRNGKCGSCVGGPCQHPCHTESEATR